MCPTLSQPLVPVSAGLTWVGKLTDDPNWINGCFEWYPSAGDPKGTSTNVYWNDRPGANAGNIGGHKICARSANRFIYDDASWRSGRTTLEQEAVAERWDSVCGDIFWSKVGPSYDWSTLLSSAGAVTGCAGSACIALDTDILTYPEVTCQSGYRDVRTAAECQRAAEESGTPLP